MVPLITVVNYVIVIFWIDIFNLAVSSSDFFYVIVGEKFHQYYRSNIRSLIHVLYYIFFPHAEIISKYRSSSYSPEQYQFQNVISEKKEKKKNGKITQKRRYINRSELTRSQAFNSVT